MSETVARILVILLVILSFLEMLRAVGRVTRPLSVLIVFLTLLEAIFVFNIVGTPGTIGVNGWILVLATAILIFAIDLMSISGGIRGAPIALMLFVISALQLLLATGIFGLRL